MSPSSSLCAALLPCLLAAQQQTGPPKTTRDLWDELTQDRRGSGPVTANAGVYRHPGGEFQVVVPAGWQAEQAERGANVSRGECYVMISPLAGPPPRGFLESIARQFGQQWRDLRTIDTGAWTLAGMPGQYGMYTGTNPKGVAAVLRIVVAGAGGRGGRHADVHSPAGLGGRQGRSTANRE